jgi:hypothetical protein
VHLKLHRPVLTKPTNQLQAQFSKSTSSQTEDDNITITSEGDFSSPFDF